MATSGYSAQLEQRVSTQTVDEQEEGKQSQCSADGEDIDFSWYVNNDEQNGATRWQWTNASATAESLNYREFRLRGRYEERLEEPQILELEDVDAPERDVAELR